MNSPPSSSSSPSSSSIASFDVFWHTKNLLLPLETPRKLNRSTTTTTTTTTTATTTTIINDNSITDNKEGIKKKRDSTIATLPSPTSLSRVGTSYDLTTVINPDTFNDKSSGVRVNKRTRRTRVGGSTSKEVITGLDEDTLKTLGALAARLSSSASTSAGNYRTSSLPSLTSTTVKKGILNEGNKGVGGGRNQGRSVTMNNLTTSVTSKGKEREVSKGEIKMPALPIRSTHEIQSLAPMERLLPASLTKYRSENQKVSIPSTTTTTTTSEQVSLLSKTMSSKPIPPVLQAQPIKTLPTRTSPNSPLLPLAIPVVKEKKDELEDEYFNSADDEFFELALSQLETSSRTTTKDNGIKKSSTIIVTKNPTTTNNTRPVLGAPQNRILVPPTRSSPRLISTTNTSSIITTHNNTNSMIPFNVTTSTSKPTTTTTKNHNPFATNNPTRSIQNKSENTFRFSGPATTRINPSSVTTFNTRNTHNNNNALTIQKSIPSKSSLVVTTKNGNGNGNGSGLKGLSKSTTSKQKLEMEELLRKEMEGLESVGIDWSDSEF